MDHQPSNERTKLSRCEDVDLKHANRMRTDRFVPNAVDTEFGELIADAGPQLVSEGSLSLISLWLVRVEGLEQSGTTSRRVDGEQNVRLEIGRESFRTWKK